MVEHLDNSYNMINYVREQAETFYSDDDHGGGERAPVTLKKNLRLSLFSYKNFC